MAVKLHLCIRASFVTWKIQRYGPYPGNNAAYDGYYFPQERRGNASSRARHARRDISREKERWGYEGGGKRVGRPEVLYTAFSPLSFVISSFPSRIVYSRAQLCDTPHIFLFVLSHRHWCELYKKFPSNSLIQISYRNAYAFEQQRFSASVRSEEPRAFRTKRNLLSVTRPRHGIIDFLTKILSLKATFHVLIEHAVKAFSLAQSCSKEEREYTATGLATTLQDRKNGSL